MKKNTEKISVVFCAGGTGGHIYPAIAVADRLKLSNRLNDIKFFVSGREVERSVFSERSFALREIASADSNELFSRRALTAAFSMMKGFSASVLELARSRPDIIVSMGGYSSIPTVLAAYVLGIPVILHEQNVLPGKANRFLARFAKKIALSFERSADRFPKNKIRVTGNPVREEIFSAPPGTRQRKGITLLVMGGSQGSAALNDAVADMLLLLGEQPAMISRVVHITGPKDHSRTMQKAAGAARNLEYIPMPYADRIWEYLSSSDLVVSRAGATAIAEIAAASLPSVLVPYPYASEGHQEINARLVEEAGAARVLLQDKLSGSSLLDIIKQLLQDPDKLKQMSSMSRSLAKPDAARKILELIYETV